MPSGAILLMSLSQVPALVVSIVLPIEVQGPLSREVYPISDGASAAELQPVRDGDSYEQLLDIYLVPGSLPDMVSSSNMSHGHRHWPLPLHDHRPRDGPHWQHAHNFTMASAGRAANLQQAITLYLHVSISIFLHSAQTVLLIFLSYLCSMYLHIVVPPM